MAYKNLEEAIQASSGNIVKMMRNSQIGAYVIHQAAPRISAAASITARMILS